MKMTDTATTSNNKMTKSQRYLVIVFSPLKLNNDPKSLLEKYDRWLPRFEGDAIMSACDFVEEFYWKLSPRLIFDEDRIMMLFSLSLEGQAREWYLSLPLGCISDFDEYEYLFMKRWSCNA